MQSFKEKKITATIEKLFEGLDDDILKTVVLYTALGKSEEEKDAICEQIRKKQEEDMKYFMEKFEIDGLEALEQVETAPVVIEEEEENKKVVEVDLSGNSIEENGEN